MVNRVFRGIQRRLTHNREPSKNSVLGSDESISRELHTAVWRTVGMHKEKSCMASMRLGAE